MSSINVEQVSWVLRRDYFCCNFYHPQSGPYMYFCRGEAFAIYDIQYFPLIHKLMSDYFVLPYKLLTLCEHHFKLMNLYGYRKNWEKDLYKIAKLNTMYYLVHSPEDVFPR